MILKTLMAFALTLAPVAAMAQTIAITGGKVVTMGDQGTLENGTVLVVDGKIAAVGADLPAPEGAQVIDARGKWVTPGLFSPASQIGLVEVSAVSGSNDSEAGDAPFSAAVDVQYAVNPEASSIPVNRVAGVTRAAVFPSAGKSIFAGYGALIDLDADFQPVFQPKAFAYMEMGEEGARLAGGSRAASWVTLFEAFKETQNISKSARGAEHDNLLNRPDVEALLPIIDGRVRLALRVERVAEILNALELKKKYPKLKLILVGASEGWRVADRIAQAGAPVIVEPFNNLPVNFAMLAATQENAKRLNAAGVVLGFMHEGVANAHNVKLVTQEAGNAVANGLPWEAAFRALTLGPAKIYGVDKDFGSLQAGKIADVVVWDGDPLELTSNADRVLIGGREMPMTSRQTELRDRYMHIGGDTPYAMRR